MRDFINNRTKQLKPSGIRKFFDIAAEMENVISLGVGEPDFITPWGVRSAGIKSLQRGLTQYTGNRGLKKLCEAVSRYQKERFGVDYPAQNIIITVGASEAIDMVLRAVCEVGDEILIPEPCYVSYQPCIEMSDAVAVGIKCNKDNGFVITPDALERAITEKTKAVILAYPNNPTGSIMTRAQIEALAPIIIKHDLLVISDEIYGELTYNGKHVSIASVEGLRERTVLISGFSKAFAMTGWRIGYVCSPAEIDKQILKIHQYTIMCASQMSQHAAYEALRSGFEDGFASVEEMRAEYNKRRNFMVSSFNRLGLTCFEPQGAFYVFPCVESLRVTGDEFATGLLKEECVALVPGSAFSEATVNHVRCSYATSMSNLVEAIKRIERYINKLKNA